MIKANELRIGNKITHATNDLKGGIMHEEITVDANTIKEIEMHHYLGYNPIPLTPEILEKCGFEIEGSEAGDDGAMQLGNMHEQKGITFLYVPKVGNYTKEDILGLWIGRDFGMQQIQIDLEKVKHLHQLQNLYWCLCGEELEINL